MRAWGHLCVVSDLFQARPDSPAALPDTNETALQLARGAGYEEVGRRLEGIVAAETRPAMVRLHSLAEGHLNATLIQDFFLLWRWLVTGQVPVAASLFAHSGINSRKMFVEELHDGKSVGNRVCELWISRDSISCINMDVALLHHRLLSPCNKKAAMRQRQQQSLES